MQVFPSCAPKREVWSFCETPVSEYVGYQPESYKHKGLKNYFQLNWILVIHFSFNLFEIEIMKTEICGQQIVLQSWLSRTTTHSQSLAFCFWKGANAPPSEVVKIAPLFIRDYSVLKTKRMPSNTGPVPTSQSKTTRLTIQPEFLKWIQDYFSGRIAIHVT